VRQGHFPRLDELPSQAGGEAGQFPLYYLLGAAVVLPFPDGDLNAVAIPNPHGPRQADDNPNVLFHKPFQGFPQGAELAVRAVEGFSILCGLMLVACTVLLARLWAPNQPGFWIAAGLIPAATPAFAYLSASVTNDILVAALSSMAILLLAHWLVRKPAWASWASAVAIAFAILAKFNAAGLIPVYLSVLIAVERVWRPRLAAAAQLLAALAVIDGWWLVRGALLYGDPTGVFALNRHYYGPSYHPLDFSLPHLHDLLASMPSLAESFLAMFGRYVLLSHVAYGFLGSLALPGLVAGLAIILRQRSAMGWLLLAWIAITAAETIGNDFISIVSGGRFLYPALAPLALIVALGWRKLLRLIKLPWLSVPLLLTALAVSASCAWLTVRPAYAYPPTTSALPTPARPLQATFDGAVELIGVDAPTDSYVLPGQPLPITLYWRLARPEDRPLSEFVHVQSGDAAYTAGAGYEGAPGAGLYPPNFWQPAQIVVDRHTLTLAPDGRTDRRNAIPLAVYAGMYYLPPTPNAAVQQVPADPPAAAAQGVQIATWKLAGQPAAATAPPLARFGADLLLQQAQVQQAGPERLDVKLDWQAGERPARDYTVFVQALSAGGSVLAQHDSYPLNGRYPTSSWFAGEPVADTVELALPRPVQPGDSVIIGVYVLPQTQPIPTDSGQPYVRLPAGS
jgi:hypothetical protein